MKLIRVPLPEQGNPNYPLPPDYASLSTEGAHEARINACRQWMIPNLAPNERALARVMGVEFFDKYYLWPDPEDDFDPGFYDLPPLETPDHHRLFYAMSAVHRMNLMIAPRGTAKTTACLKDSALCLISCPNYSIVYATSNESNAHARSDQVRMQVYDNPRINDDWGQVYGKDTLRPLRNKRATGVDLFFLNNGSSFRPVSVKSKLRGLRPRRFKLDDPEYDTSNEASTHDLRDYMNQLLFSVVLPMIMRGGAGVDWLATFISQRHFAYHAMKVEELIINDKKIIRAVDPRFSRWNRVHIRAAYHLPDGTVKSCWPHMWPSNAAERTALKLADDTPTLEEVELTVGPRAWKSEYLGLPGTTEESNFGDLTHEKHDWWITDADTALVEDNPSHSTANLCWMEPIAGSTGEYREVKIPLGLFLKSARVFVTCDSSITETQHSDYKVAAVLAHYNNLLFVLDIWSGKTKQSTLLKNAFRLAAKWRASAICPQLTPIDKAFCKEMTHVAASRDLAMAGVDYFPQIIPIPISSSVSKPVRINTALYLRFHHGLIKLPLRHQFTAAWTHLFDEIHGFNPDDPGCGLSNDDHIDTVGTGAEFLKGRAPVAPGEDPTRAKDAYSLIMSGHVRDEAGNPLIHAWGSISQAPPEIIAKLLSNTITPPEPANGTRA